MSRIGKRPIKLPSGVEVKFNEGLVKAKGSKGELALNISDLLSVDVAKDEITIKADYENDKAAKTIMGTTQVLVSNMIKGVSVGFTRNLNLVGVGYKATLKGKNLELSLGFSHPIDFALPTGITAKVTANTKIELTGCDNQLLGQVAANIKKLRPPEPYKGKGVLFEGEAIKRKAGKTGKK